MSSWGKEVLYLKTEKEGEVAGRGESGT